MTTTFVWVGINPVHCYLPPQTTVPGQMAVALCLTVCLLKSSPYMGLYWCQKCCCGKKKSTKNNHLKQLWQGIHWPHNHVRLGWQNLARPCVLLIPLTGHRGNVYVRKYDKWKDNQRNTFRPLRITDTTHWAWNKSAWWSVYLWNWSYWG